MHAKEQSGSCGGPEDRAKVAIAQAVRRVLSRLSSAAGQQTKDV